MVTHTWSSMTPLLQRKGVISQIQQECRSYSRFRYFSKDFSPGPIKEVCWWMNCNRHAGRAVSVTGNTFQASGSMKAALLCYPPCPLSSTVLRGQRVLDRGCWSSWQGLQRIPCRTGISLARKCQQLLHATCLEQACDCPMSWGPASVRARVKWFPLAVRSSSMLYTHLVQPCKKTSKTSKMTVTTRLKQIGTCWSMRHSVVQ